jgi:DNA polymerase-3 subunit delta
MLYVLHGDDEFRLGEALDALRAELNADGMLATNSSILDGRRLKAAELLQHASALPFLGAARLVLVDGLITAAGRGRAAVERWQPLLDALSTLPPSTTLVLREPPAKRGGGARRGRPAEPVGRSPLLKALAALDGVEVRAFLPFSPYGRDAEHWLRERAQAAGVAIEPRAIAALVELVGAELRTLDSELTKLARYAGERAITEADVRLLTPEARTQSLFDLIDAAVEGEGAAALRILDRMLAEGSEPPSRVQFQLGRQLGQLVRAADRAEAGGSESEIGEATGAHGYARTKLVQQAKVTPRSVAEAGLRAVERADHAVKSGRITEALSLELLLLDVAALARAAGPAAAPR